MPPEYFEHIRAGAVRRWEQLESEPELAAPWHQLFLQVQSPRHVLSELLQNADDAGATEASVELRDGCFSFSHDGADFRQDEFASLCRFGYSNKRALHTIGFRGVGFKAVFSLGEEVQLITPTLSVAFRKQRFTQPDWLDGALQTDGRTVVRVRVERPGLQREIQKNIDDWAGSPVSLLFFRSIRRLRCGDALLEWLVQGPGPIPGGNWVALSSAPEKRYLHVRSHSQPFPPEALDEIRDERMVPETISLEDFPPCHTDIVVGAKGTLFVVLPTSVETKLGFAFNGPFLQDPARLGIKAPALSPTNRWLLARIGQLAADTMSAWLESRGADVETRGQAYDLFPESNANDASLPGSCALLVAEAFKTRVGDRPYILCQSGNLAKHGESAAYPGEVLEAWSCAQVASMFDQKGRAPLSVRISAANRRKLLACGAVAEVDRRQVVRTLESLHPPKPSSWDGLLALWALVAPDVNSPLPYDRHHRVRIVPVQGDENLHSAEEVVRLGEARYVRADRDWKFLASYAQILSPQWPTALSDRRGTGEATEDKRLLGRVEAAQAVLRTLGLDVATDVTAVVEKVARRFFASDGSRKLENCVRLAHIAAALDARATTELKFATQDVYLRSTNNNLVADLDGLTAGMLDPAWAQTHCLHQEYSRLGQSCSAEQWRLWIQSGRAGIAGFPSLGTRHSLVPREVLQRELAKRGYLKPLEQPYRSGGYRLVEFDFDDALWEYWRSVSADDPAVWCRVMSRIIAQGPEWWDGKLLTKAMQVARNGSEQPATDCSITPLWLIKFRGLPCLTDTQGFRQQPADLMRRNEETEALLDSEPFVSAGVDNERNRPLLDMLGVRSTPTGPGRLLDRIRALARAETPPLAELEKWYRRLDRLVERCATDELATVTHALMDEPLVFADSCGWVTGREAFLHANEEDAPGAPVIGRAVSDLMLWRRIGVAERPSVAKAFDWLRSLPDGLPLKPEETRRVKSLLGRYAGTAWRECGRWLNLLGQLVPTDRLTSGMSMQSLVAWQNLFPGIKESIADFSMLSAETMREAPFSAVTILSKRIEERIEAPLSGPVAGSRSERWPWLEHVARMVSRVRLDDDLETERIRTLATGLQHATVLLVPNLKATPYIDGVPAGTPRSVGALWKNRDLFVSDESIFKAGSALIAELNRHFQRPDILDALKLCFQRDGAWVEEYLRAHFEFDAEPEISDLPAATSSELSLTETPCGQSRAVVGEREELAMIFANPSVPCMTLETEAPPVSVSQISEAGDEALCLVGASSDQETPIESETARLQNPIRRPASVPQPSLIERYARAQGYTPDGDERYYHPDGSWIARCRDALFPWERRSATGSLACSYWVKDHCLDLEPLEIAAELWMRCQETPDQFSLIVAGPRGDAVALSGAALLSMTKSGRICLYPATYRIVMNHGN